MNIKLLNSLRLPADIREEYWQETLTKNDFSLQVICVIIFGVELYNLVRVIFLSPSGLGTRNNRIYFGLYCTLLALAALWLLARHMLDKASRRARWGVQYGMIVLLTLWHICLNAYDLRAAPDSDVTVYLTAILALGMFVRMPTLYSLLCVGMAYGLFLLAAAPALGGGHMVNLTIATVVALGISFTNSRHAVEELRQRRELRDMNAKLRELAYLDPLTGLLNTGALKFRAEQYLGGTEAADGVTLFIIDMDDFKAINDTYGHPCGDEVLTETALRMRRIFPDTGYLGRIGGDEFAAVLPVPMDEDQAAGLGGRLIREISEIYLRDGTAGACCSVGVCRGSQPGLSYTQLYQEADQALYQAKRAGKGRCCVRTLSHGCQTVSATASR